MRTPGDENSSMPDLTIEVNCLGVKPRGTRPAQPVDSAELSATWTDENPETRTSIADALPVEGTGTRWGEELYFSVPVEISPETTRTEVPVGTVAYWPQGPALCLIWGPTPASHGDEPRAASPVGIVAEIEDVTPLTRVEGGAAVTVRQ